MNTNNWKLDLFAALDAAPSLQGVMDVALDAIRPWGFDFCSWRMHLPRQGHVSLTSSSDTVHRREVARGYDDTPCSRHCARFPTSFSWSGTSQDPCFAEDPSLFEEYYGAGHRAGWAQSLPDASSPQRYSMFFVESKNPLSTRELQYADQHLAWVSAVSIVRINELQASPVLQLSPNVIRLLQQITAGYLKETELAARLALSTQQLRLLRQQTLRELECNDMQIAVARATFLGLL